MRKKSSRNILLITSVSLFIISCQKSAHEPTTAQEIRTEELTSSNSGSNSGSSNYDYETIEENNFDSEGWKEQQVNIVSGNTIISNSSNHVEIVCGPNNTSDDHLKHGAVTMNLPTSADQTLRRIRLRKGGHSGTRLDKLTELKYSTYVVQKAPTVIVLQIDINNDGARDFNLFFDPRSQGSGFPSVVLNAWQQWNALIGKWQIAIGSLPEFQDNECTIQELINLPQYANARIIDTPPVGQDGEGIRFTIGGGADYNNAVGYFDVFIIGTSDRQESTVYDFRCSSSGPSGN